VHIDLSVTMVKYVVDISGPWRRYHPKPVPKGWRILGTIEREGGHSVAALGRSPSGLYARIDANRLQMLDQHAVADALQRVKLP
jgi:hypothetical protein